MNILFFLTPKSKIKCVESKMSVRQVLEIFEHYRYQVLPVIDENGCYIESISEGDLLYFVKENLNRDASFFGKINITKVPVYRKYYPVTINEEMSDLYVTILNQNFVPVLDDKNRFIGIVTRKSIIEHLYNNKNDED